jgi:hypothetical protein
MTAVLHLLLLGHAFGAERIYGPTPIWSKVHYDPKLTKTRSKYNFPSLTEKARILNGLEMECSRVITKDVAKPRTCFVFTKRNAKS